MTIATTPEVLEPGYLQGYDERDFTTIVSGGPDGQDCLRLNQATGSNGQSLWQVMDPTSHLWPARPATNSIAFWINRRGTFTGTQITASSTYLSAVGFPQGGFIMSAGAANTTLMSGISWGILGSNTDDLTYVLKYRSSGQNSWGHWFVKLADLTLNAWNFVVINVPEMNSGIGTSTPLNGALTWYVNGALGGTLNPAHSSSSGGSWVGNQLDFTDLTVMRFAIGTTNLTASAVQASSVGPICDLSNLSFHNRHLTAFEVMNLYEAMLYGA